MQPRVFIVHCWGGSPDQFWYPWLAKYLTAAGFLVCNLAMPDTENPQIDPWVQKLKGAVGCVRPSDLFVGHSIGCQTIMRVLKKQLNTCLGIIMVAAWLQLKGLDEEEQKVVQPWVEPAFDPKIVANRTRRWGVLLSDNDEWVDSAYHTEAFKSAFEGRLSLQILEGRGHFDDANSKEFPEIVKMLQQWEILE